MMPGLRRRIVVLLLSLVFAPGGAFFPLGLRGAPADRFDQNFLSGKIDAPRLKVFGGLTPTNYYKLDTLGMHFRIPPTENVLCGIEPRLEMEGDFVMEAGFRIVELPAPNEGTGSGLSLQVRSVDGERASVERVHRAKGSDVFVAYRGVKQPDDSFRHLVEDVATATKAGKLMLKRTGDELSFLVAETPDAAFKEIARHKFATGRINFVKFQVQTGNTATLVDGAWTDLELSADHLIPTDGTVLPPKGLQIPAWLQPLAIGLVLGTVFGAAGCLFVQRRRQPPAELA